MILNAYAILDAAMALLRLGLGVLLASLAVLSLRRLRSAVGTVGTDEESALEDGNHLSAMLASLLLVLNVLSWPLLYLLLQSYVAEWPGIMCIYGVTQVGAESMGVSRFLPNLLVFLQCSKPLIVFASGSWFVLYVLRRTATGNALFGKTFAAAALCGVLTIADAGTEIAYLILPKKEEFPSSGCCTVSHGEDGHWARWSAALAEPAARPWIIAAFFSISVIMILGLARHVFGAGTRLRNTPLFPLGLGAAASLPIQVVFLVEVLAPAVLHLPYHHCPYDLIPSAPDVLVGVAASLGGAFAIGWAVVADRFGRDQNAPEACSGLMDRLLFAAFCGYLGATVLAAAEWALA